MAYYTPENGDTIHIGGGTVVIRPVSPLLSLTISLEILNAAETDALFSIFFIGTITALNWEVSPGNILVGNPSTIVGSRGLIFIPTNSSIYPAWCVF